MGFFLKAIPVDTTDFIVTADGERKFRLVCDPAMYAAGLEIVRNHLKIWIIQDITNTLENNQGIEDTLLYQIKDTDLKFLPYQSQRDVLERCLIDTEINFSGSRLFDAITRINIEVPMEVLETIKGKFLYSMIYGLPKQLGKLVYPTKEDWIGLLADMPWVPFLVFVQEIFDSDEITNRISKLTASAKTKPTVTGPGAPAIHRA